jgi:hypothetical protein
MEESDHVVCLLQQGFTRGLAHSVYRHCKQAFSQRIWIVDNSGSMITYDGRKLVSTKKKNQVKWELCSRWEELKECVTYHAQMAALLDAPTTFTLLNPPNNAPQSYGVAELGPDMVEEELASLFHTLSNSHPSGVTPLARHLRDIYAMLVSRRESLRREGRQVMVCLATDGLPTDESGATGPSIRADFERALQMLLRDMPVWMVVRLCTNDETILTYYETLDSELELNLEVLDDYLDEAKEVNRHNPWLTYGLPLHRCREMGFHHRLLDLLDERRFALDEVCEFLQLLFGESATRRDPQTNWEDFIKDLKEITMSEEEPTYDPIRNRINPWINIRQLERCYGPYRNRINWLAAIAILLLGVVFHLFIIRQV